MINGIINVYKEQDYTSHDVVARLRGILKQKKIGHTGTLDPNATGVLPVCLGRGTKMCDMLTDHSKTYKAVMLLGETTDTLDKTGRVLSKCCDDEISKVQKEHVIETINSFVGEYNQVPPMYSALKVNGQKLYDIARTGQEVERKARPVKIYEIDILSIELPRVTFFVTCSKGTYIRSLCDDIGRQIGCGACMESLERTKVDIFELKDSITLDQIEQYVKEDVIQNYIMPLDKMFDEYESCVVNSEGTRLIHNGNPFNPEHRLERKYAVDGQMFKVYDKNNEFIGIFVFEAKKRRYKPVKMFFNKDDK